MKAYELISDEKKLCRGNFAVSVDAPNATYVYPGINPENQRCIAIKWDLQGALIRCYGDAVARTMIETAKQLLVTRNERVRETNGRSYVSLAEFSDHAPHREIVLFLKELEG